MFLIELWHQIPQICLKLIPATTQALTSSALSGNQILAGLSRTTLETSRRCIASWRARGVEGWRWRGRGGEWRVWWRGRWRGGGWRVEGGGWRGGEVEGVEGVDGRVEGWSGGRVDNSGLQYSYGVDDGTLRWIYFLDPPRGLGCSQGGGGIEEDMAKAAVSRARLPCCFDSKFTRSKTVTVTSADPKIKEAPGPQKYVKIWCFWLFLVALSYYFTYFWGPGVYLESQWPIIMGYFQ